MKSCCKKEVTDMLDDLQLRIRVCEIAPGGVIPTLDRLIEEARLEAAVMADISKSEELEHSGEAME